MRPLDVPSVSAESVAGATAADMAEIDRIMIEDLHIELIQTMENAGRHLARVVIEAAAPSTVAVAAGSGGTAAGAWSRRDIWPTPTSTS